MTTLPPEQLHTPVLVAQCWELLRAPVQASGQPVIVDATVGMGGHSEYFLSKHPTLRVVGIDRDQQARQQAARRLAPFGQRVTIAAATYDQIPAVLQHLGLDKVQGIIADLGVSSLQLDDTERGFSYSQDADLDMRMDQSSTLTAKELLAKLPEAELAEILHAWGEERYSRRIARLIAQERQETPITTSAQLVELIRQAIPAPARRKGGNPAKRTFQALRIAVNNELDILARFLPRALECLDIGGHLVVESYQSLEDRLVKQVFRAGTQPQGQLEPQIVSTKSSTQPWLENLTKGALQANAAEIEANPRAASVRLRAVKKIGQTPAGFSTGTAISALSGRPQQHFETLETLIKNSKTTGGNRE